MKKKEVSGDGLNCLLQVGGATKESMEAAGALIMSILKSGQEQKTIRAALSVVEGIGSADHSTISDCSFIVNPKE